MNIGQHRCGPENQKWDVHVHNAEDEMKRGCAGWAGEQMNENALTKL